MKNYVVELKEMLEVMEKSSYVNIESINSNISYNESEALFELQIINNEKKYNVSNDFKYLIEASLNPNIYYHYSINDIGIGSGEFSLRPFYNVLVSTKDPLLWNESLHSKKEISFLKNFRIIDDHPFSGDFKLAAAYRDPVICPPSLPELYFYDRGKYYKMNIDYFGYMDALIDLAGITNWQYLFCDVNWNDSNYDFFKKDLKKGINALKIIFSNKSFEKYENLFIG